VSTSAGGELFRYSRDGAVRIYSLRVVPINRSVFRSVAVAVPIRYKMYGPRLPPQ